MQFTHPTFIFGQRSTANKLLIIACLSFNALTAALIPDAGGPNRAEAWNDQPLNGDFTVGDGSEVDVLWKLLTAGDPRPLIPRDSLQNDNVGIKLARQGGITDLRTINCKNTRPAKWAITADVEFPTVKNMVADIKACGNVGLNTVFWSFGTQPFPSVDEFKDTLNPTGAWWETAMPEEWFSQMEKSDI